MTNASAKKDELDLLRSMFVENKELHFLERDVIKQFDNLAEAGILNDSTDLDIRFVLKILDRLEVTICLPKGYPSIYKPIFTIRSISYETPINERGLSSEFTKWLEEAASGEPLVCSAIEWLDHKLSVGEFDVAGKSNVYQSNSSSKCSQKSFSCLWIVSHHIKSSTKRALIMKWAKELDLSGCVMPGSPGIIIAEGEDECADEFWSRIRALTWKRIQLKCKEPVSSKEQNFRFHNEGFIELFANGSERVGWLHSHNVPSDKIELILGVSGQLKA